MQLAKRLTWLIPLTLLVVTGFYYLPPVHDRLGWRVDNLRVGEAIFRSAQEARWVNVD